MRKPTDSTLVSISKHLNLSVSTVSRALSGQSKKYRISDKTTKLILETARKFNYRPNQLARGLILKRTNTVGIIIPDITNPFFANIVRWIERAARDNGVSILISDSNDQTSVEQTSLKEFIGRKIDGLIISPVGQEQSHLREAKEKQIPIVLIDRNFSNLDLPYVGSENFQGTKSAIEYLIKNGHQKIGFIQGLPESSVNMDRVNGYRDALEEHHIPFDPELVVGNDFGVENGYTGTKLLLSKEEKVTAIFAASNLIALGTIKAINESGLHIPRDISLIAYDEQFFCEYLSIPLTTVSQQSKEIGYIAYQLLTDLIKSEDSNNKPYKKIELPTKLILRNSVKDLNSG